MKKILSILVIVTLLAMGCFVLTGCGAEENSVIDEGKKEESKSEGVKISDISVSNWEKVIKENFALDISLPSGWSVKEVNSPNNYSNVELILIPSGATTYNDFGETIFSLSKEASTKQAPSVETFQDSLKVAGTSTWRYYPDIQNNNGQDIVYVQINYSDNKGNVEITIQK